MIEKIAESNFDTLVEILTHRDITHNEYNTILDNGFSLDINLELCKAFGVPIKQQNDIFTLKTKESLFSQIFCIVDIETTGNTPKDCNIIEIGAIKYQNGKILDRFESYVFSTNIPPKITEITGICDDDTINAPHIKQVLEKFKIFLQDSVFMAHNVLFDFNFINEKLSQNGFPVMKNRKLCTLNLARKTIKAQKYGLGYLNEFLDIHHPIRHRAYADCIIALKVFEKSLLELCEHNIKSAEDLIAFSKTK